MTTFFVLVAVVGGVWLLTTIFAATKEKSEAIEEARRASEETRSTIDELEKKKKALEALALEKTKGFPWLAAAYDDYCKLFDQNYADEIQSGRYKQRAAPASAEKVREAAALRRAAEREARILRYQIEFYESMFPWLVELKEEGVEDALIARVESNDSEGGEETDPSVNWLSKAELTSLPENQRFQIALDRYWNSRRSKWEIGRDYERFVGYEYESKGFVVSYHGIAEGLDDLGRDLICKKSGETHIVQCKNWSQKKTIHEKHIFQLYGTFIAYRYDQSSEKVSAHFVTSTSLSERAAGFAKMLGVTVKASQPWKSYPCIKCNISHKDKTKIFHLPFDQQYDRTTIELARGEFYATTVAEAIGKGFRRAYRYKGLTTKTL